MSDAAGSVGRAVLVTALVIATLGFGAMSLCGGYWTVVAIPALFAPGGGGAVMIFIISLPCLIGGFFMARLCARKLSNREPE